MAGVGGSLHTSKPQHCLGEIEGHVARAVEIHGEARAMHDDPVRDVPDGLAGVGVFLPPPIFFGEDHQVPELRGHLVTVVDRSRQDGGRAANHCPDLGVAG